MAAVCGAAAEKQTSLAPAACFPSFENVAAARSLAAFVRLFPVANLYGLLAQRCHDAQGCSQNALLFPIGTTTSCH